MQRLIDLVLPSQCPGCSREGEPMCRTCRLGVERRLGEPSGVPLGLSASQPAGLTQLEWCSSFTGPTRAAIHALKYDGERRLAGTLGRIMAARWRSVAIGGDRLVPVPVHAARRRQRGFDQAELLANEMARSLGLPVVRSLRREAATEAQHALGRQARAGNVGRAFSVEPGVPSVAGGWPVLVDDVVTTGATLEACAAALHEAGAAAVSAICLARER